MKTLTSKLKIIATFLISTVVAFLCPLKNAYAYDLGKLKFGLTVVGLSANESSFTQNSYSYWAPNTLNRQYWNMNISVRGTPAVPTGSYIVFEYLIFNRASSIPDVCPSSSGNFSIVNCTTTYSIVDTEGTFKTYGYQVDTDGRAGWLYPSTMPSALQDTWVGNSYIVTNHKLVLRVNRDYTAMSSIDLGGIFASIESVNSGNIYIRFSGISVFDKGTELSDILTYLEEHPDTAGEQMQDSRDEAEQAQQDAQNNGSSSQQQADSSGHTLLGALTSFVGAITNVSPGNCSFTLNTGYGFNLGEVNLCSISPPASFQVISSLVVIGFAVPLSISASKKMIELFRGFTG